MSYCGLVGMGYSKAFRGYSRLGYSKVFRGYSQLGYSKAFRGYGKFVWKGSQAELSNPMRWVCGCVWIIGISLRLQRTRMLVFGGPRANLLQVVPGDDLVSINSGLVLYVQGPWCMLLWLLGAQSSPNKQKKTGKKKNCIRPLKGPYS